MLSNFLNKYARAVYQEKTWFISKIIWSIFWLFAVLTTLYKNLEPAIPAGLCHFIPCSYLNGIEIRILLLLLSLLVLAFYILEREMKKTLLLASILSLLLFSFQDSSGILNRTAGFSMIFIAQLLAYFLSSIFPDKFKLQKYRVQFSLQVVVAFYSLAFLSKMIDTGAIWPSLSNDFANEVLKSWLYEYASSGELYLFEKAYYLNNLILEYPFFFQSLLFISCLLEAFALISLFHRKVAFFWGIALLSMHIGIAIIMDIYIAGVLFPMLVFLLNIPAIIVALGTKSPSLTSSNSTIKTP